MPAFLVFILIGVAVGFSVAMAAILLLLILPAKRCQGCSNDLPKLRRNPNRLEAMRGISRCPSCGCRVDAKGRLVPD
jgi:hypothetical protein